MTGRTVNLPAQRLRSAAPIACLAWLSALLLLIMFAAPPLAAQPAATDDQPAGTITLADGAPADDDIAARIRAILAELDGYEDVRVSVASGIVTLSGTTLDTASAQRLSEIAGRVQGVVAVENEVAETTDVVRRLDPLRERLTTRLGQFVAYLPLLAIALLAFGIVVAAGLLLARLRQPWARLAPNAFIADILRQLLRIAFVIAGLVIALDILNATALLSTILGAAGIIGLAIGFAVRDTVENFIASVMLSIRQPFRPNDAIEIDGDEGKVIRLTSRATILLSYDGNHIRIPNATVFKSRIVNFTRNPERRFSFSLGVAGDSDLAQALQLAQDTLTALPFVLTTPAVAVWIERVGDSTIEIVCTAWIDQTRTSFASARSEAIRLTLDAFGQAGISMPEPTYRVLTLSPPEDGATGDAAPARPAPPAGAASISALDTTATTEQELEQIVEQERATRDEDDLLKRSAPEE